MKLNEKNVASFAVCNSPIDKEGFLLKKGEVNKGYQRRWFILKGNLLFYFERSKDKEPIGVIVLEGCTVELSEQDLDSFTFCINFPGPGCRSYVLAANSQEEMESWMKIITCASYDYMKLMVAELHKQLEECNLHLTSTLNTRGGGGGGGKEVPSASICPETCVTNSSSSSSSSSSPQRRFNPFNTDVDSADSGRKSEPTVVGNTVFHARVTDPLSAYTVSGFNNFDLTATCAQPEENLLLSTVSFEEMHEAFGARIRQKMLEQSMTV